MTTVIDLAQKFADIDAHWRPRVVAELNGQHVRLAKIAGPFVWHRHDEEDELFLVHRGRLEMHIRDEHGARIVHLDPGQMIVIPRGVEHMPVAPAEVELVLFEPASTVNTGNADDPRRLDELDRA